MEGKKISFGFMKTKKADKPVVEEKRDFIECVEEKSIKVVGGEEVKEITPLIIPMKPNTLVTAERLKEIAEQVESVLEEPETIEKPAPADIPAENETIDQMVVRELLQDAKKDVKTDTPMLTVPLPAKPVNEGEKESTLDDYEAVPIQDFGLAMLRGMGWTPNKETSKYKQPQLRPKGLGLGADKVVKDKQKQKPSKDGKEEELNIVKNAYVKITTGKYGGYYGKVVSLDEDNGRVMVEVTAKRETVSLSEFMMHAVTKAEFDKESKVINADSFQEYKKRETQKSVKTDKESSLSGNTKDRSNRHDAGKASSSGNDKGKSDKNGREGNKNIDRESDRDRSQRNRRDSSDEQPRQRKYKRDSSNESTDSLSDKERHKKYRKRYSSADSSSDSERKNKKKDRRRDSSDSESDYKSKKNKNSDKRDIDKKRKGKKKKRDRDRSPNYRKHKK